jgi:antitoxin MazE
MEAVLAKIGTSRGIRIPAPLLKELGQPEAFDLQLQNGKLILSPLHKKPREGWDGAFAQMAVQGDDALLIDDALDADLIDVV